MVSLTPVISAPQEAPVKTYVYRSPGTATYPNIRTEALESARDLPS